MASRRGALLGCGRIDTLQPARGSGPWCLPKGGGGRGSYRRCCHRHWHRARPAGGRDSGSCTRPPPWFLTPLWATTMGSLSRAGKGSGRGGLRTLKNVLVHLIDVDNGRLRIGHGRVPRVVWRVSGVLRLLLHLSGSFRACHPGPGTQRLVAPLAEAAGGPFLGPIREAGVGRADSHTLPVLRHPLRL